LENVRRNAIIALGNVGDPAALPVLAEALTDASWPPRIRRVAAWALGCIATPEVIAVLRRAAETEADAEVRCEIDDALGDASRLQDESLTG